jgi:2-desacetyl-2-hydroxyethyl bacteriochlorophyllide A dehydrogenase
MPEEPHHDMKVRSLIFTGKKQVEIQTESLPAPGPGEVLVRSLSSAISPGSELLIYRGDAPQELPADSHLPALQGGLAFPLKYGYALVGEVVGLGEGVTEGWLGQRVFCFHPHQSHILVKLADLHPIPANVSNEAALFLPNMETAVNFIMDGRPLIGERVLVLGQGVVGLLTTGLLGQFPLEKLIAVDQIPTRLELSRTFGANLALLPEELNEARAGGLVDLSFELTGSPQVLDTAIYWTGFGGRIVIGSWYGQKRAAIDLGGLFHRRRLRMISSQVSTLDPSLTGRWDKQRRFDTAWKYLTELQPARLITQSLPFEQAAEGYRLLDEDPDSSVQVVFHYE